METKLFRYLQENYGWTSKTAPKRWLDILGWSQKKFYRVINGEQVPSVIEAGVLASILQCQIDEIFDLQQTNQNV